MSAKYSFDLESRDNRRPLPRKLIFGQSGTETTLHTTLKLLGYLLFFRERLQVGLNLHMDSIPFVPDLVQLDYTLRPVLWVECGDCGVAKLHKLAVKIPDAELWVMRRSIEEARALEAAMAKAELRRNRYKILALDPAMVDEIAGLLRSRNSVMFVAGEFESGELQMDFNGLWFDAPFEVVEF